MSNFSFKTIDVPAAAGTYEFISVDGVDPAGEAVGNYGNTDGDGDSTFHGLTASATGNGVNFDPPGSSNTDVVGITSSGEIFGDYTDFANRQYGFVDNNGVVTQINIFLANSTTVNGVNDEGVIYGEYADFANSIHGFVDTNGTIAQVDVPGALSTVISGVNASGVIAGTYTDPTGTHGYVDTNGSFKTIDPAGSIFTSVVGISDSGLVVGNWEDSSNTQHSFIYNNGVITTISIPGATSSGISAINASGEIVGYYTDSVGNVHGFIDENGVVVTVDIPGATETNILGVNALGELSGYYNDSSFAQHGFVGTPASTVIQTDGSTSLTEVGFGYFLDPVGGGTGPYLQYGGTAVTTDEFGAGWTPIGAVQISGSDYEVVWSLPGGNQYSIWTTDSSGHFVSQVTGLTGTSYALEAAESVLDQDLNGDGTIGLVQTLIHTDGSTSLTEIAQNYFLYDGGVGPELQYGGAPVTVGEFGAWAPIGAIQTSGGYEVVYSLPGGNQYSIWTTDSSGHFVSQVSGLTGTSFALEAAESVLGQDLNGDGTIGLVQTLIHTDGSTSLTEIAQNYFLYDGGVGPELQYGGAPVTVGEFGAWAPIGAIQTGGGYEVVFSLPGGNQYSIWTTDSSGHFVSQVTGLTGTSYALEAAESVLGQDLNGDGTIGLVKTLIQTDGSTTLNQIANEFFLDNNSGVGPALQFGGAVVTAGEFGAGWTPIGAVQTSGGYEVVYSLPGGNQYSIWTTDSSGNFVSQVSGLTGSSPALEAAESVLGQDLNGDGVIGSSATIATGTTLELHAADSVAVHFNGPTGTLILDHSTGFTGQISNLTGNGSLSGSDQIDLKDIAFGTGTTVAYSGNSTGGTLTVSDAEGHTANIALAGNYTGSTFALSSDGSGGTTVIDPPIQQANGGGSAGFNFNFDSTPASSTAGTPPATVTVAGAGHDAFAFHPGFGADVIVNAASSDTIELDGFSSITSSKQLASLLAEAQAGQPQSVFHSANGGHDTVIDLHNHDSITLTNFHLADLHASNFIIH